tara:strand:- start:54 stop:626 length:573 start_codon:yes stop_codon:yes gene_type:complete
MKRVLLIISLHLFLFLIVFSYQAQAEDDEWDVEDFDKFIVVAIPGEVIHGDKLRFFIRKSDCSKVGMLFSFSTTRKPKKIKDLQDQRLPIRINNYDTIRGAKVVSIHEMDFITIVMMQTAGNHEIKEFIGALQTMYDFEKEFRIELVKHDGHNPEKYFDILHNNWKLDLLIKKIEIAQSMCLGPDEIKTS